MLFSFTYYIHIVSLNWSLKDLYETWDFLLDLWTPSGWGGILVAVESARRSAKRVLGSYKEGEGEMCG